MNVFTNHQNAEISENKIREIRESAMTFSNLVNIPVYLKSVNSGTVVLKSDLCYMEKW